MDIMLVDGTNSDIGNKLFCNGASTCQVSGLSSEIGDKTIENFENVFCNGRDSCVNTAYDLDEKLHLSYLAFENIANSICIFL